MVRGALKDSKAGQGLESEELGVVAGLGWEVGRSAGASLQW